MPVICLVRHGQASFGAQTYDVLSPAGREQAAVAGAELARRALRDPLVVCGTLERQRDTAAILAEAAGWSGPPRTDARWNEYDHLGVLARYGTPLPPDAGPRAVQPRLDGALRAWIEEDGTGEDGWKAFATGATTALDELVAGLGAGRDAVVVTSGGVLAAICGALLRTGADGVVALHRVAVNAAITTVVAGGSGTSLLAFNDHAHFTGDRRQLLTYR